MTVINLRTACDPSARWLSDDPPAPKPKPAECHTDPDGNVRLTIPHDVQWNTVQATMSSYCVTLTLTPERWRQVLELVASRLATEFDDADDDDDTREIVVTPNTHEG